MPAVGSSQRKTFLMVMTILATIPGDMGCYRQERAALLLKGTDFYFRQLSKRSRRNIY
jgi:hypothetical protein